MLEAKRTFIFSEETEPFFKKKLGEFHERFDTKLIMCGVDSVGVDMQTVNMSKMPNYDMQTCKKIVGGFLEFQPDSHVVLIGEDDQKGFELVLCDLFDNDFVSQYGVTIDNVFMIQNAYNYPQPNKCLYQMWVLLEDVVMKDINNFWHE